MERQRIGIVGIGKIARDQHIPNLRASDAFVLAACASRHAQVEGVANFPSLEAMLKGCPDLDAVAICTPPQVHYEAVTLALRSGKHVFLEKPPCTTTAQLAQLAQLAQQTKRTLFQTWHSRYAHGVAPAKHWLSSRQVRGGHITWKEDVRQWHPGQAWIWQAGGFGVFDPGINAISILTEILHEPVFVSDATLLVPSNCETPIAAELTFTTASERAITASFDFRHTGIQTWDIDIETDKGSLKLSAGGSEVFIDGRTLAHEAKPQSEYAVLYGRFAELIAAGQCDVDGRPFQLVADSFLIGKRQAVEAFID